MKNKLVSIIIPIYNAADYIERCILSLVSQTYKNIEIIAVNDGSTDDSLKVLNKLKNKYNFIKIYDQKNSGVSSARNKGIEVADGEYLFFIDADDYIFENCIETLMEKALLFKADIVRSNFIFRNKPVYNFIEDKLYDLEDKKTKKEIIGLYINTYYFNSACGQIIRKKIIKDIRFNKELKMGEDFKFNIDLVDNVNKLYVIRECLYFYTYNTLGTNFNDSLNKIEIKIKNICTIYDYLYNKYDKTLVCKNYLKGITPQLLKINEYDSKNILYYLENQRIFVNTIENLKISDLNNDKYFVAYILVLNRKWTLLKMMYKLLFKPLKKIKFVINRRK